MKPPQPDATEPAPEAPRPGPESAAPAPPAAGRLRRIQEAAAETGLTPRAIRYYEELGLLRPAGRSSGAYRLYDDDDLERLRFIKGLRDDAGFSLAEIAQLLEDEAARARNRARFRATHDVAERRAILGDALARADRQLELLRRKAARLATMIEAAEARRAHLLEHLAELQGEAPPATAAAAAARGTGPAIGSGTEPAAEPGRPERGGADR